MTRRWLASASALSVVALLALACTAPPSESQPSSAIPLEGTRWKLVELDGKPIQMPAGADDPYVQLQAAGGTLEGFAGCNRIMGAYKLDGDTLMFPGVAASRRFCESTAAIEQGFLAALTAARSYRISGSSLELLAEAKTLARLEAL
jgi:heat shock protein HslJ